MNRAQQIFLAAVFALGLTGKTASAAPMDHDFPVVASASKVEVITLDINNKSNKQYTYMLAQPEIYAAEAKALIGKNSGLAARLRSMNVQLNNIVGIVTADDGSFQALLRISPIEAGARKSRFTHLDMKDVFETVAEIFSGVAEDNGQAIIFEADPKAAFPIEDDKKLPTQLEVNLVENAINHCPAGTRIVVGPERRGHGYAAIGADNGPGIEEGERERVFRRLYRLDKSRNSPGHGLGLSMVKAIADLHGLAIRIEDNRPGARFALAWTSPSGS